MYATIPGWIPDRYHTPWIVTNSLLPLNKSGGKPVKTLIKTVSGGSTTCLDVPLAVRWAKTVKSKLISHFGSTHGIWKILFVSEYQQNSVTQFVFVQHSVQFIPSGINTVGIIGIHNEDQTLCVLVVMAPQRTDLILTTDIPNREWNVLVFNSFNVES